MSTPHAEDTVTPGAVPLIVDQHRWAAALNELRAREKAATRELDAIALLGHACRWSSCPPTSSRGTTGRFGW